MMQTVLIAGCGDVGSALGLRLAAAGRRVIGLKRHPATLPPSIEPLAGDVTDLATLGAVPDTVGVLVYAAAADGFSEEAYRRAYVDGLANVLEALKRSPLARAIFVSSTSVYGQDAGEWVDESSATEPAGFSGRILLEAEALLERCGAPAAAVRFGGIYGPGRSRLIERVRSGAGCDDRPLWTNRIHRDDCAGVLEHLLGLEALRPVYLGVDCEPAPQCRVMDWLAARLGVAPPPRAAPAERRRGGSKRCSNRALLEAGYRFTYPSFREGYAAMLPSRATDTPATHSEVER